ncbi:MAG: ABC transporter ATP-binding protein, partial [Myxococcales bacterium]|nr:ABC transporter ATP-binding protein [Myxococcales bacterium]
AKAALAAVDGVRSVELIGPTQLRVHAAPELRPALVRALVGANVDVLRVDRAASQLESIFTELTA